MSKSKHAYLILAHGNSYVLEKLILLLDDERNDIYIHVDKKTEGFDFHSFKQLPQKSKITFIDQINVYWGHISLVEVEMRLFRAASTAKGYNFYHLISGSDLPLKTQNEIHDFFDQHKGKEFLGFSDDFFDESRVTKIHLFPKYLRAKADEPFKRLLRKVRSFSIFLQKRMGYVRGRELTVEFKFGSQWASLTHQFVTSLLKNEKGILQFYRYSNASDEVYKQTFAYNSKFKGSIFDYSDELNGCQRLIDWKRGRPYTFREEDFQLLMSSDLFFARKFEDTVDKVIVDKIYRQLITQ